MVEIKCRVTCNEINKHNESILGEKFCTCTCMYMWQRLKLNFMYFALLQ